MSSNQQVRNETKTERIIIQLYLEGATTEEIAASIDWHGIFDDSHQQDIIWDCINEYEKGSIHHGVTV